MTVQALRSLILSKYVLYVEVWDPVFRACSVWIFVLISLRYIRAFVMSVEAASELMRVV